MDENARRPALQAEARRLEEGASFYEASHRLAANQWRMVTNSLGGVATVAGALSAGLAASDGDRRWYVVCLSLVAATTAAMLTFFKPTELSAKHLDAAVGFNLLRHDLRRFRLIECTSRSIEEADERLQVLLEARSSLLRVSPAYSNRTYTKASKAVRSGVFRYDSMPEQDLSSEGAQKSDGDTSPVVPGG